MLMRSEFKIPDWAPALNRVPDLTSRELEVFELLAHGATNAEISRELVVTERTVRAHTGNILSKLGLRSRLKASLVAFAYTQRLALEPMTTRTLEDEDGFTPTEKEVNSSMKKTYESPALIERGAFAAATAGFGRFLADQLVGRLIP
ncbi:response regulator transcription factor [Streptomyces sp. NPDC088789]|uniref:response regulator transcription factor n=1 Tax=Streptomyces sp. NPDC088789 TaxID=3365899 RepID=UPI003808B1A0